MRIYLDACCLQRPFDDQTQPRIRVEAEAVLAILAAVQAGAATLIGSEALEFEIQRIPDEERRTEALAILSLADERLLIDQASEALAKALEAAGMTAIDALHVAMASVARVDFFCTADDRLLRRAQATTGLACRPVSILTLIAEVTP